MDVRFGSKADICNAIAHVRFAPDNDRESGFPQKGISALPPKADISPYKWNVRFGPKADMQPSFRTMYAFSVDGLALTLGATWTTR